MPCSQGEWHTIYILSCSKISVVMQIDSVLQLPLYTATNDWELISICSLNSECLYMIDVSSVPEFESLSNSVFLRCHWNVDFM